MRAIKMKVKKFSDIQRVKVAMNEAISVLSIDNKVFTLLYRNKEGELISEHFNNGKEVNKRIKEIS